MYAAHSLSSVAVGAPVQRGSADALLEQLLGCEPDSHQDFLERLLVAPLASDTPMPAPQLRPTGRRTVCTPHTAPSGIVRPMLRVAAVSLLASTIIALSAGAPIALAVQPETVTTALVRVAAPAGRSAVATVLSDLTSARPAAGVGRAAVARAAVATPASLPAFELVDASPAADVPAAPAPAPAGVPASRVATLPAYTTVKLPPLDLNAQQQPPPPYPQVAPPPPPPPSTAVEIYNPSNVEVYNPAPAAPPAAAAPRPATQPARPATQPARPATQPPRTSGAKPVPGTNYVVQRGDYLRLLSTWSYGNEMLWPVIYDANQRVIGRNPDLILPGQVFAIPTRGGSTPSQPVRAYVVQPGDTLSSIALKVYGNANRWSEIYRANSKAIGAFPNLILPGTRLALP